MWKFTYLYMNVHLFIEICQTLIVLPVPFGKNCFMLTIITLDLCAKFVQNELIYNSFQANAPILYTLKMSENQSFVDTFRGQRQPFIGILTKRCSENMQQIYRRTLMPKCDFNKIPKQLYWNCTSTRCSPASLVHIFRTPFTKNTS